MKRERQENTANEDNKQETEDDKIKALFDRYNIKSKFIAIYGALSPSKMAQDAGIADNISDLLLKC